jgi:hypothetical protein
MQFSEVKQDENVKEIIPLLLHTFRVCHIQCTLRPDSMHGILYRVEALWFEHDSKHCILGKFACQSFK